MVAGLVGDVADVAALGVVVVEVLGLALRRVVRHAGVAVALARIDVDRERLLVLLLRLLPRLLGTLVFVAALIHRVTREVERGGESCATEATAAPGAAEEVADGPFRAAAEDACRCVLAEGVPGTGTASKEAAQR